ncbi:MAG: sialidase family protein [Gallionellaceae bacterium]|jgi:predicted neuraminidase
MRVEKMPKAVLNSAYILLLLLALVPVMWRDLPVAKKADFVLGSATALDTKAASMTLGFVCEDCLVPSVHGATVIQKLDGDLFATWFGGSREGGKDVVLWGSYYLIKSSTWSKPRVVVSPAETQAALGRHIKTVGNSVLVRGSNNALLLYYVSVSVGGWAGSALNVISSADDGKTWSTAQRLITSPFFNISTLNKCAAVHYSDGSIGLPVYHEFIGKFSELLHIDSSGRVLGKARITHGRQAIQPLVLPLAPQSALALMRDTGPAPGHVLSSRSDNGGQYWHANKKLALANPDSAIAGLRRPDGSLLLVFNDIEVGRNSLALAVSHDQGTSWQTVRHIEQSKDSEEFSYPYLIRSSDGNMHLLYTWNRKRIRHVVFNDAWVDGGKP